MPEPATTITIEAQGIREFFTSLDIYNPSWDLLLILFFLGASILYGMSLGRDRLIIILISVYMSLAIVQAIPDFILSVKLEEVFAFHVTTFVGLFILLFFILSRSALLRTLGNKASRGKLWQVALFSFLHIGLILSVALSYLPQEAINMLSPFIQQSFIGEWARFIWIAAPLVGMFLVRGEVEE